MSAPDSTPTAGDEGYVPVACSVHDRFESWAVRRTPVEVVWRSEDGERRAQTRITDVYARDGADWVALGTGDTVRADRLASVGGGTVSPAG